MHYCHGNRCFSIFVYQLVTGIIVLYFCVILTFLAFYSILLYGNKFHCIYYGHKAVFFFKFSSAIQHFLWAVVLVNCIFMVHLKVRKSKGVFFSLLQCHSHIHSSGLVDFFFITLHYSQNLLKWYKSQQGQHYEYDVSKS